MKWSDAYTDYEYAGKSSTWFFLLYLTFWIKTKKVYLNVHLESPWIQNYKHRLFPVCSAGDSAPPDAAGDTILRDGYKSWWSSEGNKAQSSLDLLGSYIPGVLNFIKTMLQVIYVYM